jgi:CBS domain-containing protein
MKPIALLLKPHHHPDELSVLPTATVYAALELLASKGVGALMVMDGDKLMGIFSERDYCRKVALKGRNSHDTLVADVMTPEVFTVSGNTGTRACMLLMRDKHFRHLPVVDGGKVLGLVSMRDIMDDVVSDHEQTISHLESYINS